jgi:chromosome partitioning protein
MPSDRISETVLSPTYQEFATEPRNPGNDTVPSPSSAFKISLQQLCNASQLHHWLTINDRYSEAENFRFALWTRTEPGMPTVTFANTKGGAGKTTAVLLVATELDRMGLRVVVLDADPQHWISRWHEQLGANCPEKLNVIPYVTAANVERHIQAHRHSSDFILLDLPGARSPLLAQALGYSNHVMIPVQGSAMDAQGAANVIDLLRYLEEKAGIRIPHSVLLTRVNPIITTRALQGVKDLLIQKRVHLMSTPIVERAAFRDVFSCGETLYTMDPGKVSNLARAIENAQLLGQEVLFRVQATCAKPRQGSEPCRLVA